MIKKIVAIGGGENGRILENGYQTMYETQISGDGNDRNFDKGYVLKCYWKNNKYYEKKLEASTEYKMLSELLCTNITDLESEESIIG